MNSFAQSLALLIGLSGSIAIAQPAPVDDGPETVVVCGDNEPGERMIFSGRVLDYQGKPLAKAVILIHQTDVQGLYTPKNATSRLPRLRASAVTDDLGRFRFSTIRPGAYPDASQPPHIHAAVAGHIHHLQFVTFLFDGDPLLTDEWKEALKDEPEARIVKPVKGEDGTWRFEYDIRLEDA